MHLLFVLFDFTIVFCFAWDDYVASFCNSPLYRLLSYVVFGRVHPVFVCLFSSGVAYRKQLR